MELKKLSQNFNCILPLCISYFRFCSKSIWGYHIAKHGLCHLWIWEHSRNHIFYTRKLTNKRTKARLTIHIGFRKNCYFIKVTAWYIQQDDITGRVTIKGTYNDDELSFSVDITSRGSDFSELPLHRLAAKTLIDQLENDETGLYSG